MPEIFLIKLIWSLKVSHRPMAQTSEEGEMRESKRTHMIQEPTRKRAILSSGVVGTSMTKTPWHRLALAAILVLSAFLNLYNLSGEGYANDYYSAAVKNMLTSWHNFFFVSFDAGFISVDKPPLGLWIQAASAYLFGFHRWAQALYDCGAGGP
jgi:hypothetical protein